MNYMQNQIYYYYTKQIKTEKIIKEYTKDDDLNFNKDKRYKLDKTIAMPFLSVGAG